MQGRFNEERHRLTTELTGLVMACPFTQGNPVDCPLHELRKRPVKERVIWAEAQSLESLHRIVNLHTGCLSHKEKSSGR